MWCIASRRVLDYEYCAHLQLVVLTKSSDHMDTVFYAMFGFLDDIIIFRYAEHQVALTNHLNYDNESQDVISMLTW